jgi:hypothetical protein
MKGPRPYGPAEAAINKELEARRHRETVEPSRNRYRGRADLWRFGRITGIHVSHLSTERHEFSGRAVESALLVSIRICCARMPLGGGSCILAEPDIHLLPQAPNSRRRRLSLCSLPVPKQSEESLGSCLRRPAGNLRDLAVCASHDPDVFPFSGRVFTLPRFA